MVELNNERVNVVKNYIANAKSKGYSDDQIKQSLLKSGVDVNTISSMLSSNISVQNSDKTEALKKYVYDARARGYSDDQIRKALLKSGTDENTINSLLGASARKKAFYKTWWFSSIIMLIFLLGILFAVFYAAEILVDDTIVSDDDSLVDSDYVDDTDTTDYDYYDDEDSGAGEPHCGDGDCNIGESCVEDCGCDDVNDCGDNEECNEDRECVEVSSSSSSSSSGDDSIIIEADELDFEEDDGVIIEAEELDFEEDDGFTEAEYVYCTDVIPTCADGLDNDADGSIDLLDSDCDSWYDYESSIIIEAEELDFEDSIDSIEAEVLTFEDEIVCTDEIPTCADGLDNDADGSIDLLDSDCDSWYDYESSIILEAEVLDFGAEEIVCTDVIPTCADGLDNDADGSIDLLDSDCDSWYDYESSIILEAEVFDFGAEEIVCTDEIPTCADGLDNDADGSIDLLDSDCDSWYDYESSILLEATVIETEEIVCTDEIPTCADGLDNDADGSIDLLDSDCDSWYDYESSILLEATVIETEEIVCTDEIPTCADGLDNDADGSIDLLDSDCDSWYSYEGEETESVEEIVCTDEIPTCADGLDNDADGSIDLLDSDCDSWYSYEVETGVQETDSQVECNKNGDCDSGVCISNSCITCEDNDGQDYEVQGSSSGYVSSLEEERSVVDVCGFGDALNEYYCNKIGYLVYDSVDCVAEGYSTCENGICIIIEGSISEDAQELMAETEVVIPVSDSTETVVSSTVDECTNGEWVVEEECFEDTDCGRARYSCENNFCVGSDLTCDEYNDENGCSDSGYCNWETVQVGTTTSSYCDGSDKDEDSINAYFDCNERDATINPQASEDCADGLDNNCDGLIDCADSSCSSDSACSSYSCDIAICNNDLDCADQGDNNYCNLDGCCVDICEDENLALGVEVLSSICYSNDDCGTLQECNIVSGECETVAVQIGRNVDVEKFRAAETDEGIFSRFFSWVGGLFS